MGSAIYGQQCYTKAQQGTPDFQRNFSEDINCVVQEFAKGRLGFYGIRADHFKLQPSVHYELRSGETLTGYVLEGKFHFDHVAHTPEGDSVVEYMAKVDVVEVEGGYQSGCDIQPCTKLYLREARPLHKMAVNYVNKAFGHPHGLDVTGKKEHEDVLQAFCDLHDRIGDLCLSLTFELEDFYGDQLVEWSDVKRGF
jgi:hypothetical protein